MTPFLYGISEIAASCIGAAPRPAAPLPLAALCTNSLSRA